MTNPARSLTSSFALLWNVASAISRSTLGIAATSAETHSSASATGLCCPCTPPNNAADSRPKDDRSTSLFACCDAFFYSFRLFFFVYCFRSRRLERCLDGLVPMGRTFVYLLVAPHMLRLCNDAGSQALGRYTATKFAVTTVTILLISARFFIFRKFVWSFYTFRPKNCPQL